MEKAIEDMRQRVIVEECRSKAIIAVGRFAQKDAFHHILINKGCRTIVAHNESFDRNVLQKTLADCGIDYSDLEISDNWDCTLKIYRQKGYAPATLSACCKIQEIELEHHEALSDARACAQLYLKR